MPSKHPDTRSVPHTCEDFKPAREVDAFTALLSIVDFIDHDLSEIQSLTELKIALVIWRKTHGWGKTADAIGDRELCGRVGMNRRNMQRLGKLGSYATAERAMSGRNRCRTVYHWPVNERVRGAVEKAREGGIIKTPPPGVQGTPPPWRHKYATQSIPDQSVSESERSKSDFCPSIAKNSDEQAGLALVRTAVAEFMEAKPAEVPDHIPTEILREAGAPVAEVLDFLAHKKLRYGPGTRHAPREWGWFPTVVRAEFNRRREAAKARAESPTAHWSDYVPPDHPVDWSAIELPDADPPPAPRPHHMEHGGAVLRRLAANL
jgi:hypothetical protein